MLFGRDRRVKTDIPAGTFVVDLGEPDPRAPRELKWWRGVVIEAQTHEEAVERTYALIERINTVRRISGRLRR